MTQVVSVMFVIVLNHSNNSPGCSTWTEHVSIKTMMRIAGSCQMKFVDLLYLLSQKLHDCIFLRVHAWVLFLQLGYFSNWVLGWKLTDCRKLYGKCDLFCFRLLVARVLVYLQTIIPTTCSVLSQVSTGNPTAPSLLPAARAETVCCASKPDVFIVIVVVIVIDDNFFNAGENARPALATGKRSYRSSLPRRIRKSNWKADDGIARVENGCSHIRHCVCTHQKHLHFRRQRKDLCHGRSG